MIDNILNFYKKYIFLKPLWRTLLLHYAIMFYHASLYYIIPRCLREVFFFSFASKTYLPHFPFVKYFVSGCLGRTILFGFNIEFYSFTMLPFNSIILHYQNAERERERERERESKLVDGMYNCENS